MPGLPEAIVDVLTTEALARSRAHDAAPGAGAWIARLAQGNETALRLARVRLLSRAERGAEPEVSRRAACYVAGALADLERERP